MKNQWITRIEWVVAILLSIAVLFLLFVRATHAGALWRDESGTVQLALMPRISDILHNFQHQTLPPLFPLILRAEGHFFGDSDTAWRFNRLWTGVAFIGIAWFNSRLLNRRPPLVLLALLGMNSTFLFWGGYPLLGIVPLLAFGLSARLLLQPTYRGIVAAAIAGILSVQLLINNLVLVLIIFFAAVIVCLTRRLYRLAGVFTALAFCCTLSDIAYLKIYSAAAEWAIVLKVPTNFQLIWNDFFAALGRPYPLAPWIWSIAFLLAITAAGWQLAKGWPKDAQRSSVVLFALVLSILAPLAYFMSVRLADRLTHPRHFIPLVALLAATLDLLMAELASINWLRLTRLGLASTALLFFPFAVWPDLIKRQSNIDNVAHQLEKEAGPNDLIVVNPWPLGISFSRYYHGATPWVTIPPIEDHRIHRYDLVKSKMREVDPLREVFSTVRQTLQSANRVWIVGGARPPEENLPTSLPPAPDPQFGWSARAYSNSWSLQLGDFLRTHVQSGDIVISPAPDVSETENVPLLVAQGWRD